MKEGLTRATIDIKADVLRNFDLIAKIQGKSRTELIRDFIDKYVEENKHELENILKK